MNNHECNYCHTENVFYQYKESKKYIWYNCLKCFVKRRVVKETVVAEVDEINVLTLF